jgi:transposase
VGYEVFPGANFEGHTLIPILKNLRERYQLEEVIFVADRGMLSEDNLTFLEQEGFQYIVGARVKNTSNTKSQN